ncbi:protocadherin gamma-C5-like isoform X29 [Paramormyrops kingsleyae]|uniref:protocadherin gamma-C5-like isoform X29 n=1 Tax=Paramormyrops kingsleyae TaxID=1676925 RepID=UPI003B971BD5
MINRGKNHLLGWQALRLLSFLPLWNIINGQIRYTIPEEMTKGSVVGNLAKDLALGVVEIAERKLRIASEPGKQYFSVDLEKGELAVSGTIDRESLCGQSAGCVLPVQLVIENPLQLYRVEVEVQDINDNSPAFLTKEHILEIAESVSPGTRFPLESAEDADVGSNSLRSYVINTNECFSLNIKSLENGRKTPELILDKTLDREKLSVHKLVLTAVDGGNPAKSGTTLIHIVVQDINDNAPQFDRTLYKTSISENVGNGTTVLALKATDLDEGPNAEIQYYFGSHTPDIILKTFSVNPSTGDIIVVGQLDFEEIKSYTFDVRAKDRGNPSLEGHSSVQVDILDENDNSPEVILTSLPNPVQENAPVGTVIALINVKDLDSGENGKVDLQIPPNSPFKLKSSFENHYSLVTDSRLDREISPEYNIVIIASDLGSPRLQTKKIVNVKVLDVNDNPPVFSQPSYNVYVIENNPVGLSLYSVSASDIDADVNSLLSYSILDSTLGGIPVSSYFYINSENGTIYSLNSFDYERNKVFHVVVQAKDQGSPSLSSNATVHVFIQDQNDNAPVVIYPSVIMGSTSHQKLPRSAKAGHLVTKVTAVDADSGHNAWISYKLVETTDGSLFNVNLYTGEVRTKRAVSDQDDSPHRLLIEIKDNGEPIQSTTVTVGISLEDGFQEPILDLQHEQHEPTNKDGKITFYLIIALASISAVSLLTFVILTVKCIRNGRRRTCCCMSRGDPEQHKNRNLHIQLNTDGPIKYVEVLGGDMLSQSQSFRSCLSPMSEFSDLTLIKPSSTMDFKEMVNVIDASLPDSAWTFESQQQKPPNTDWRFSQNQRPGPSGAGVPPEGAVGTGPWPNPPTEAEQLQALMAAANEVSEATATLGPGTMGLSTRYSPQFTLQHVPDYRQNVYIPGSTATLTANPQQQALPPPQAQAPPPTQAEAPKAAQTPASKKKSAKKEKK